MQVGILGGTFDPIHIGHLLLAEEARVRLRLERVLFVPAGRPWHKGMRRITTAHHRVAMVRLAIADNPAFQLSLVDVERPGPSYSVDTLSELTQLLGPEVEFYFLAGSDSLATMSTWRDPERLLQRCWMVAARRPGNAALDLATLDNAIPGASAKIIPLDMPAVDISSSAIRQRIAAGVTIRYQVPELVERYISQHRLYAPKRVKGAR